MCQNARLTITDIITDITDMRQGRYRIELSPVATP